MRLLRRLRGQLLLREVDARLRGGLLRVLRHRPTDSINSTAWCSRELLGATSAYWARGAGFIQDAHDQEEKVLSVLAPLDALAVSDPSVTREAQRGRTYDVSGVQVVQCGRTALT